MDRTDYQILNILQKDCRTTLKSIGDQVGLTAPAVSERTRRMEEQGIIRAYRIEVDRERLNCNMTGFIFAALEPEKYNDFCEFCKASPAIIAHYHIIGVFNALLRFAVQGTPELETLLTAIKQYGDSQTSVALKTYFDTKDIPLPEQK
jgi:Lrp/AsnC family leucine-responsive transcriptional regulator